MIKNKKIIVSTITMITVIILIITVLSVNFAAPASAVEYMKNSAQQRLSIAELRYSDLSNNPSEKSEVLISLSNTTLDTVDALLPNGCEIIRVYHFFSDGNKTVTGAYNSCRNKNISDIQKSYFTEIYNMLLSNIEALEEEKQAMYNQYMLDFSISPNEFDPEDMNKDWVYQGESISEIAARIAFNTEHLERMESVGLDLRGIRIKATNADLLDMLENENVKMIEILDYDNNDIIVPPIFN